MSHAYVTLVDGPHAKENWAVLGAYGELPRKIQVGVEIYGRIGDTMCFRWMDPEAQNRGEVPMSRLRGRPVTLQDVPALRNRRLSSPDTV